MPNVLISLQPLTAMSAVTVTALTRSDTNMAPVGVSLPISLSNAAGVWSATFTDPNPPPTFYSVTADMTQTSGQVTQSFTFQPPPVGSVSGFWTSQSAIAYAFGQVSMDLLSNLNNQTPGADTTGYLGAIQFAESEINYALAWFGYPTGTTTPPFPTTSMAYTILSQQATILAACWLYQKRGLQDDGKNLAGQFAASQCEARKQIKRIIVNKIPDVDRGFVVAPRVVRSLAISAPWINPIGGWGGGIFW